MADPELPELDDLGWLHEGHAAPKEVRGLVCGSVYTAKIFASPIDGLVETNIVLAVNPQPVRFDSVVQANNFTEWLIANCHDQIEWERPFNLARDERNQVLRAEKAKRDE